MMEHEEGPGQVSILFCCMGNICRSPTAEGVMRALVEGAGAADFIEIDSAGTHAYHVGNPPDERAQRAALRRGVDLSRIRARRVQSTDFERFDYVLAMDRDNLALLETMCPEDFQGSLRLFLSFAPDLGRDEVPDPYYGGTGGFDRVLSLVEEGCAALLAELRRRHAIPGPSTDGGRQSRSGVGS